jgi:O-antigen/teichoic acid export membrane protein
MARSEQWYAELNQSKRRRMKARSVTRASLVGVLVLVLYYVLPMDSLGISGALALVAGLLLVAGVVAWQIRAIINSPWPRTRQSKPWWSESLYCSAFSLAATTSWG